MKTWLLDRLSENSTWRGFILLATALGVQLDSEKSTAIVSLGLAAVGLINVLRKSPKPNAPTVSTSVSSAP